MNVRGGTRADTSVLQPPRKCRLVQGAKEGSQDVLSSRIGLECTYHTRLNYTILYSTLLYSARLYSTLNTIHYTPYTKHHTLYTILYAIYILFTVYCILYNIYYILYAFHYLLCSIYYILYTISYIIPYSTLPYCTLLCSGISSPWASPVSTEKEALGHKHPCSVSQSSPSGWI